MTTKFFCCVCDFDMSAAIKLSCNQGTDQRAMLQFKGMTLIHAAKTVELTCPNGHTCSYPCLGDDDGG